MQGDFECSLDNDEFKHIDIHIQRRSERHGRTPTQQGVNLLDQDRLDFAEAAKHRPVI